MALAPPVAPPSALELAERLLIPRDEPYDEEATVERSEDLLYLDQLCDGDLELSGLITSIALESFWNFLALACWTQDEKDPESPYKPFPPYAYVKEIADIWEERDPAGGFANSRIAVIKSRQMQLSWLGILWLLYLSLLRPASKCVIVSRELDTGEFLIQRLRESYEKLPRYLVNCLSLAPPSQKNFTTKHIRFPNRSEIVVRPQRGGQAARSISPTAVLLDEAAFQEDITKTMTSVMGGQPLWAGLITTAEPGPIQDIYEDRRDGGLGGKAKVLSNRFKGLEVWKNRLNGFTIVDLYYYADPVKATPEWKVKNYAMLAPFGAWQWDKEMEHDFSVRGGLPIFDMFDPSIHISPVPFELDLTRDRPQIVVPHERGARPPFRDWVTLGFAVDHGHSHGCGTLWMAKDTSGDLYAYRDRCVAGMPAGQNALAIRGAMSDEELRRIHPSYQLIDASAPLADRNDVQVGDLYRYADGRQGIGAPIMPRLDNVKKGPGSVDRGIQEISQMLLATMAQVAPTHEYFKKPSRAWPTGMPPEVVAEYANGRMLLISPLCTELVREIKGARWQERRDPTLNAPDKEIDRDNHVWKCLSYLLAEGFGGR